jgi:hypothetical protein
MQANFPFNSSIEADRYYDRIPVISTLTNLYIIFQKCILIPLAEAMTPCQNNHYFTHLQEKSLLRCIVLLFPFLGNLALYLYDCQYPDDGQEFAKAVLRKDGKALEYATPEWQNEKETVELALNSNPNALQYASSSLRGDREFILACLNQAKYRSEKSQIFLHIDEELKKDREFALKLAALCGSTLQYMDESFQNDREIVFAAIKSSKGLILRFASESLRNDKDLVREAVISSLGFALEHASVQLKNDKAFVLEFCQKRWTCAAFRRASDALRDDEEVARATFAFTGDYLNDAGEKVKNNKELVLLAIKNSSRGYAYSYASHSLKWDPEVRQAAEERGFFNGRFH